MTSVRSVSGKSVRTVCLMSAAWSDANSDSGSVAPCCGLAGSDRAGLAESLGDHADRGLAQLHGLSVAKRFVDWLAVEGVVQREAPLCAGESDCDDLVHRRPSAIDPRHLSPAGLTDLLSDKLSWLVVEVDCVLAGVVHASVDAAPDTCIEPNRDRFVWVVCHWAIMPYCVGTREPRGRSSTSARAICGMIGSFKLVNEVDMSRHGGQS